jgi:hypothetical protein
MENVSTEHNDYHSCNYHNNDEKNLICFWMIIMVMIVIVIVVAALGEYSDVEGEIFEIWISSDCKCLVGVIFLYLKCQSFGKRGRVHMMV